MIRFNNSILAAYVLIAAMLSACNKYSYEEICNVGGEILFSTSEMTVNGTRSFKETTLNELEKNGFRVLAKVNSDGSELFNSKVVKQGGVWKVPDRRYYFPTGSTMNFYAVYPDSEVPELSGEDAVINYTADTDKDIIIAESVNVSSSSAAIALSFSHVLSQVQFQFQGGVSDIDYLLNSVEITAPSEADFSFSDGEWTAGNGSKVFSVLTSRTPIFYESAVRIGEAMSFVPGVITVTVNWTCSQEGRNISDYEASFNLEIEKGQKTLVSCTMPDCDGTAMAFNVKTNPWEESNQEIVISKVPEPLKFEADGENYLSMCDKFGICYPERVNIYLEYSYDKQHWYEWEDPLDFHNDLEVGTPEHPFIYIRGENPDGLGYYCEDCCCAEGPSFCFLHDGRVRCSGNIMSLIDYRKTSARIPGTGCFSNLFQGIGQLVSAPELPATELSPFCYHYMFYECSNLKEIPVLPATVLEESCYEMMFGECSSIEIAPELPAMELAENCYCLMFSRCRSLTEAPELQARILAERCYFRMFYDCNSLNHIKCLATNLSASECIDEWTVNVSSTGEFEKAPRVDWPTGNSGIPSGWMTTTEIPDPLPGIFTDSEGRKFQFSSGYLMWDGKKFTFESDQLTKASDWYNPYHISRFYYSRNTAIAIAPSYSDPQAAPYDPFFAENGGAVPGYTTLDYDGWEELLDWRVAKYEDDSYEEYFCMNIEGTQCILLTPEGKSRYLDKTEFSRAEWEQLEADGFVAFPIDEVIDGIGYVDDIPISGSSLPETMYTLIIFVNIADNYPPYGECALSSRQYKRKVRLIKYLD